MHCEAGGLETLAVHLGQDDALGEVERSDRDHVVVQVG